MPPWRRVAPLECSDGTRPRYAMSWRGLAKRVMSPSSAITVAAATRAIPRSQRPIRERRLDFSFQTVASRRRRFDCGDAVFKHDVMRRLLESESGHPATMHQSPRRPIVVMAMTQEKARELLTGLAQTADGRKTRAYEISDRLMSLIGNPDSGQFTSA